LHVEGVSTAKATKRWNSRGRALRSLREYVGPPRCDRSDEKRVALVSWRDRHGNRTHSRRVAIVLKTRYCSRKNTMLDVPSSKCPEELVCWCSMAAWSIYRQRERIRPDAGIEASLPSLTHASSHAICADAMLRDHLSTLPPDVLRSSAIASLTLTCNDMTTVAADANDSSVRASSRLRVIPSPALSPGMEKFSTSPRLLRQPFAMSTRGVTAWMIVH